MPGTETPMALTFTPLTRAAARRFFSSRRINSPTARPWRPSKGTTLFWRIFPLRVKRAPASLVPPRSSPMTARLSMSLVGAIAKAGPPTKQAACGTNRMDATDGTKVVQQEGRRKSAEEELGGGVGEAQTFSGELEAVGQDAPSALLRQLGHVLLPLASQIVAGCLAELLERPARYHPQAKGSSLPGAGQRRQFLARLDWVAALFELLAVELGVGAVLRAHAPDIGGCAGTQPVKGASSPVIDVVLAGAVGDGGR